MKKALYLPFILLIIVSFFSSCLRPRLKVEMKSISRFTWKIVYTGGKKIDNDLYPNGLPIVKFTEDGKISGSTGCNEFGGEIILEETDIAVSRIQMTKRACPDPSVSLGKVEDDIIQGLESSNQLFLEGNTLIFLKDDRVLLRLRDN